MNKKSLEERLYELLGIKLFRKIVFLIRDSVITLFTLNLSKERRKELLYNTPSNYNIGKINCLEDIKNFKKQLYMNSYFHVLALSSFGFLLLTMINNNISLYYVIFDLILTIFNSYAIMLQRYNIIRINRVIKKMTPSYEKEKDKLKEEIKKEDNLLKDHSYKIIDNKNRENTINLERLIDNASLNELKQYLELIKRISDENNDYKSIKVEKEKVLKLELKQSRKISN